jgi:protocatechuate 4,5-dioxygenase alpha chain
MTRTPQEYDDIPGTFVFDAERSRQGYGINMFCMSLMKEENRKAFKADEAAYLQRFQLTAEQRDAILKRDYNRMLQLGGNIYFTAQLGATDGHSFQHCGRHDRLVAGGLRQDDVGGRPLSGRKSQQIGEEQGWGQAELSQKANPQQSGANRAGSSQV